MNDDRTGASPVECRIKPGGRRKVRMCWTCCDACHSEHATKVAAFLHWLWLRATRRA